MKKVLFAASFQKTQARWETAIVEALERLGWDVETFDWSVFFSDSIYGRAQRDLVSGPSLNRINRALIAKCEEIQPEVVFIFKGIFLTEKTLKEISKRVPLLVSWNADDPFGNYDWHFAKKYEYEGNWLLKKLIPIRRYVHFKRHWSRFIKTIPCYDICFVIREKNIALYMEAGASEVHLLRCFFIPSLHHPTVLDGDEKVKYETEVAFVGHYEPDHRTKCLETLLENGIEVRVYGSGWDKYLSRALSVAQGTHIRTIYEEEYVKVICASKISLCFFSKLNKSTHTTRSFEIPACGSLLLSERTDEMKSLFEEDREAVYFSDQNELLAKVRYLLAHSERRNEIAAAGYERCLSDGHDVYARMREWNDAVVAKLEMLGRQ